ncbi:hypothetical protein [Flavobacterium sp.]|nr:hypothetical protein [Flavobacterium sp.]
MRIRNFFFTAFVSVIILSCTFTTNSEKPPVFNKDTTVIEK